MLSMKHLLILFIAIGFFSCNNEKVLELPEINHSKISKIDDISVAYLFYDSEKDSIELNRRNLISTTNWLVNVDKRISLKLAIPQIKFLQNKKKNAGHKKEGAKNYFTCNDTSIKNLGFIDFTKTEYIGGSSIKYFSNLKNTDPNYESIIVLNMDQNNKLSIIRIGTSLVKSETSKSNLIKRLQAYDSPNYLIYLNFNENLNFQDYITYKSLLENLNLKEAKISNKEFIFN